MNLSEKLLKDVEPIWQRIFVHPFVEALFAGSLPAQKFRFYLLQDYNYLVASIKNFALLASRTEDVQMMRKLIDIAYIEATGEFEGYEAFLKKMNLTIEEAEKEELVPEAISYVSFLLATSSYKSVEEGITAVLPCYWSYAKIAKFYEKKLSQNKNELYREWASYYLEKDYLNLVDKIINIVDQIKSDFSYKKLCKVFIASSRYELMFWDAVYCMKSKLV